jgi:hypothetical protein
MSTNSLHAIFSYILDDTFTMYSTDSAKLNDAENISKYYLFNANRSDKDCITFTRQEFKDREEAFLLVISHGDYVDAVLSSCMSFIAQSKVGTSAEKPRPLVVMYAEGDDKIQEALKIITQFREIDGLEVRLVPLGQLCDFGTDYDYNWLQALRLVQYSKLVYIRHTLFFKGDANVYFDYQAPSAVYLTMQDKKPHIPDNSIMIFNPCQKAFSYCLKQLSSQSFIRGKYTGVNSPESVLLSWYTSNKIAITPLNSTACATVDHKNATEAVAVTRPLRNYAWEKSTSPCMADFLKSWKTFKQYFVEKKK